MDTLEVKKIKLELKKVSAARDEIEIKILEKEDEIKRMQEHMKIQELHETKLSEKLKEMGINHG